MRKNKANRISFLFTKYYLLFTIALLVIFGGIYTMWNEYYNSLLSSQNIDTMFTSSSFRKGHYEDVNAHKYLGISGGFAVLDKNYNLIYSSNSTIPKIHSKDTLLCIPEHNSNTYWNSMSLQTSNGNTELIITQETYSNDQRIQTNAAILNSEGHVIEGRLHPNKESYTKEEISYMTGSWSNKYNLERYHLKNKTVLLLIPQYTEDYFQKVTAAANQIWLLALPAYFLIAFLFVILLNRCFKIPLERLNQSIVRLGLGKKANASECGGPLEIQEIGVSFDEMAYKLSLSNERTKKLEQQRAKMLADISHDLKTPITVISGYINALKDGKIPMEDLPQYMETIEKKVNSLTELINSFHEYSKTEHPDFHLDLKRMDLCEFLREYLAEKFDEINQAGFLLDVKIPEEPILCDIDSFQFKRAFNNILNNALQYNRLGTVIRVSLTQKETSLLLSIADNGVGIPDEIKKDLFSPFVVGNQSRSTSGSGLGLSITKKIINAHGWNIRLADTKNMEGTIFEIEIPILSEAQT